MKNNTRSILSFLIILLVSQVNAQSPIKITLLGTGAPVPSMERFGPSILVEAGGQKLLFDCGRGASQRLWQLKIPLGKIDALFLTHLHSDHIVGIPDLWLTGWIPTPFGSRNQPFQVLGPEGTREMMEHLVKAYAWDINIRKKEKNKADSGVLVKATDIKEGSAWEKNGVKVTPFTVRHSDFIDSALGYRIDYAGHSVILSGDTRYSENLVRYAKGADVIVHEVAAANEQSMKTSPLINQILGYHTSPEECGKIFEQIKPKLAVYSHIVLLTSDPSVPPPTIDDLIIRTKKFYKGSLQVGEDLLSIEISDKILVTKYISLRSSPADSLINKHWLNLITQFRNRIKVAEELGTFAFKTSSIDTLIVNNLKKTSQTLEIRLSKTIIPNKFAMDSIKIENNALETALTKIINKINTNKSAQSGNDLLNLITSLMSVENRIFLARKEYNEICKTKGREELIY